MDNHIQGIQVTNHSLAQQVIYKTYHWSF